MISKGNLLKNIRKRWDSPEKLLDYLLELDKQSEIDIELAYKKGLKETVKNYSVAVAYTLNYKFGFGKKRLPKLMEEIYFICDSFKTGHLSLDDCNEELKRVGVHIV